MMPQTERALELTRKYNPDQAEVYASRNRVITVRMATKEIVESKVLVTDGIGVRIIVNNSVGFASTNDFSNASIDETIEQAYHFAKAKKPDSDFKSLPGPKKSASPPAADREVLDLDVEKAAEFGRIALETFEYADRELDVSGSINIVNEECFIRNSLGVDCSDTSAFIFSSVTAEKGEDVSTVGQSCARSLKEFDPTRAATEAVELSLKSGGAKTIQPGTYDIVVSPHAFAELAEFVISYAVDLSAVDAGFSYFAGRLGDQVASPNLTLIDDGRQPTGIASKSYDDEGIPTGRTVQIEHGILRNFVTDSYYANKLSTRVKNFEPTGNGFRFGSVPGRDSSILPRIQPTNIVVEPGTETLDSIIAGVKQGILLGRIWYTYAINPTIGEFSTTNRGSTFLIENGKVTTPILPNTFRINDNIQILMKNISTMSKETIQSVVWGGASACISPYVLINNVNITYSKS